MHNNEVKDRMISTKKNGKIVFDVIKYAKIELLPASPDTISGNNGKGLDRLSLDKVKNKQYF